MDDFQLIGIDSTSILSLSLSEFNPNNVVWGFGVILVGLFRWGYFGLGLFHSYCSPFSTVDMVKGILCLVVFCTMISLFQSEGRGGSTITTIIGPLAHETSTFNPIGTFQ